MTLFESDEDFVTRMDEQASGARSIEVRGPVHAIHATDMIRLILLARAGIDRRRRRGSAASAGQAAG